MVAARASGGGTTAHMCTTIRTAGVPLGYGSFACTLGRSVRSELDQACRPMCCLYGPYLAVLLAHIEPEIAAR